MLSASYICANFAIHPPPVLHTNAELCTAHVDNKKRQRTRTLPCGMLPYFRRKLISSGIGLT
jgi:hypothetical protein